MRPCAGAFFCDVILSGDSGAAKPKARIYAFVLAFFWTVLRVPALAQSFHSGFHGHNESSFLIEAALLICFSRWMAAATLMKRS